jgi:uncharacterized membrane protein
VLVLAPATVHADVNDFIITDFRAEETLTRDDPQGAMHVIEHINVTFNDFNHGIYRAIPNSYSGEPLHFHLNSVTSDRNTPTKTVLSKKNGNTVLKIGEAGKTVTGPQEYTIDYTVDNVLKFYDDHAELYWDVNGDQWQQPFTHVSIRLHMPTGILQQSRAPRCFAGSYGSNIGQCSIASNGNSLTAETGNLSGYQTLTFVAAFKPGYFSPPTWIDRILDYKNAIFSAALLPLLTLIAGFVLWYKRGRDDRPVTTVVPQYAPPKGITPLVAGTIADFSVDSRDYTATYIDLARRGYLRIVENRKDRLIGKDKLTYTLELMKADISQLDAFEAQLVSGLFGTMTTGETVNLNEKKNKLYKVAQQLKKDVGKSLKVQGYFRNDPTKLIFKFGTYVTFIFILAAFFLNIVISVAVFHPMLVVGVLIASLIAWAFLRALPARTALGCDVRDQLMGLKLYIETAEKDRIRMLEAPGAKYAAGAGAPKRTVDLFEELLPYAIVMGVEKQWAEQFKDIYKQPPDWYSGNINSFNAGYLIGSLNGGFAQAVNTSFSAPSSSGSSGFGGGGFSGGGGGGGGGGGW